MNRQKVYHWVKEIFIAGILLFILSNIISYIRKPDVSQTDISTMEAKLLDSSHYTVNNGKPLLIHFWATWCPTCKLEASNIQFVSEKYEVLTIAVNSGSDAALKAYMDENEYSFKVINDHGGKWAKDFNIEAYPTTFIYDKEGKLKFSEVGYTTTAGLLGRLKLIE